MSGMGIEALGGLESVGFTPFTPPTVGSDAVTVTGAGAVPGAGSVNGTAEVTGPNTDFTNLLAGGIDKLEAITDRADQLGVAAATGTLTNIHDYTVAATEASVATQLTTALRNKALEAFQEIMRIPI